MSIIVIIQYEILTWVFFLFNFVFSPAGLRFVTRLKVYTFIFYVSFFLFFPSKKMSFVYVFRHLDIGSTTIRFSTIVRNCFTDGMH